MIKSQIIILIMLNIFSFSCTQNSSKATYGQVVKLKYGKNKLIIYPDFKLTFKGERREKVRGTNLTFIYYDFEVETSKEKKTISWTSGTGVIGPAKFEINGKTYFLERKSSERFAPTEKEKYPDRTKSYTRKVGNYGDFKDETIYIIKLEDNEIVISEEKSQE